MLLVRSSIDCREVLMRTKSKQLWFWLLQLPRVLLLLLGAPLSLMASLFIYAWLRKRTVEQHFVHLDYPPVEVDGHQVQLFDNGAAVFHDMLAEIERAQSLILLETYIFERDEVGMQFKRALVRKARQGVPVRIIFDGVGSLHVPVRFKLLGWRRNIRVFEFGRLQSLRSYITRQIWVRDHRKILVIDGRIAYLGGMNIGREYADIWRDTQLKIVGPLAANAGHEFADVWNLHFGRYPLELPYARTSSPAISILGNRPFQREFSIRAAYLRALALAERNVFITNAYFIPDREIINAVIAAAQRGVDVCVMLPFISDNIGVDWMARGLVHTLLAGDVRVLLYHGTMLHSKTMTVDGRWSTVGSANLDTRSMLVNYEINAVIDDPVFARQMEAMFLNDSTQCREVVLDEWLDRPLLQQFGEWSLQPLRRFF